MSTDVGGNVLAVDSSPELRTALALKLKGFAEADRLASIAGLDEQTVQSVLEGAAARGDVAHRSGRVGGWHLTAPGRAWLDQLMAQERRRIVAGDQLERGYEVFLTLNADFKAFCSGWQQEAEPRDVLATYVDGLARYDDGVSEALAYASAALSRFAGYRGRFASARQRFADGDLSGLTRPLSGSFHDVWMELHQDLLLTLGRDRTEADGH